MPKHSFTDYFKGFEKVEAVRQILGGKTEEILGKLRVEFTGMEGYMFVDYRDGHLVVDANYLKERGILDIYLGIVHELVHVRQFMEGKELFDDNFNYVERPTEIEAYRHTIDEARRLGMNDDRICQYLRTEWMDDEELEQLRRTLYVDCSCHEEEKKKT